MSDFPAFYFRPVNDNVNPSNVDRSFVDRLKVKNLQKEIDDMLSNIEATSQLNGFFSPLVGESGISSEYVGSYDLSFDEIITDHATPVLPMDYFYNLFSLQRPKPRLISINETPLPSTLKANLEVIKNEYITTLY